MRRGAALALTLAVAAGCGGGDGDQSGAGDPTQPVRAFVERSYRDDHVAACAALGPGARRDLIALVGPRIGIPRGLRATNCVGTLRTLQTFGGLNVAHAGVMDAELARRLDGRELEFERPSDDGDTATVRVEGSAKDVCVRRVDGRWLVDRLDFSDVR